MPRITNVEQLRDAMRKLQYTFLEQQNTDVSISRAKFNDWADSYGNKTLLFQSLYTKGIPINDLAKWLSPTANQGQVRNAVVKINDISYVQGIIGRNGTIEDFKRLLNFDSDNLNTSIANDYAGSIRYWWSNQSGNETSRVRTPRATRTTSPTEPTTSNGGTTSPRSFVGDEITEGVLNSCYEIIKSFHASIQWWISNRTEPLSPTDLSRAWDEYLTNRLLNPDYALLTNPPLLNARQNLEFWRTRSNAMKVLLQKFSLMILLDLNDFTRAFIFKITKSDDVFLHRVKDRLGNQNTIMQLKMSLDQKHPSFKERVKLVEREQRYLQLIYLGRSAPAIEPDTSRTTTTESETAANTLVRDIPFTNTFGVEIEYFYTPISKLISEGKKLGIKIADMGYTHNVTTDWKIVTDGSVSGTNARELVSPILKGKKGLVEMRKCLNAMANAGALVNESCGLHLHFGARDLTLNTWKNLLLNYDGYQSIIDKFLAVYRRGDNRWSRNLSSITDFRQKVRAATSFRQLQLIFLQATGVDTGQGTDHEYRSSARYYSVNLMPYAKHGTIEFRQHGGNIEVDSVTAWVLFMHYLLEVSKKKELTSYTFQNIQNFTPVALSTFIANRIFDLSDPNRNIVTNSSSYEDRS